MLSLQIFRNFVSWTWVVVFLSIGAVIAWFIPWVAVLHLGFLVYFPYEPDGASRYTRVTGPLVGLVSDRWVASGSIPRSCRTALVASEDTRFYEHRGVDFDSIEKSYEYNKRRKKIKRGGSTITQQLVKNAFLSRDKSYLRKARELTGSMILDFIMSKESQITWYFNVVEFGPKVYGIEDAAMHYFKRHARELTPSQCISLVAILPGPVKWGSPLARKTMTPFLSSRYRTILSRMILMGLTDSKAIAMARSYSPFGKSPLPSRALPSVKEAARDGVAAAAAFEDETDAEVAAAQEERDGAPNPLPETPEVLEDDTNETKAEASEPTSDSGTQPPPAPTAEPQPADPIPEEPATMAEPAADAPGGTH